MADQVSIPEDYLHRVYAGVLGKLIGVYLGRPFENWTHQQILEKLGPVHYYTHEKFNLPCVVIDDDVSGTFTFVRALEEHGCLPDLSSEQVGKTWLNNVVEQKSIFWWGGNGISTEHTAYINLKHKGLVAPESGSSKTNGRTVAEQIGAQIFIDGWAMVAPGNPDLAAKLARAAARVSHDGEAVHAAVLWAVMEAEAFLTSDVDHLLNTGLSYIPPTCEIASLITKIRQWAKLDRDWQTTRNTIEEEYGYDKYHGNCHVIPNHGIMVLALLYGGHDFSTAMHIINTCGWDTDCNSGNVGCLMAIMHGLQCFEGYYDWRGPVADLALISSADGGYGINNATRLTYDIAGMGYKLANTAPPYEVPSAQYHFTLPGSVQGFNMNAASPHSASIRQESDGTNGKSSLRIELKQPGQDDTPIYISTPTFTPPEVLKVSRTYDMMASPLIYPGQTLQAQMSAPTSNSTSLHINFGLKFYDPNNTLMIIDSPESIILEPGQDQQLTWKIPRQIENMPIQQVGLFITSQSPTNNTSQVLYLHTLSWSGTPHFTLRRPLPSSLETTTNDNFSSLWKSSYISSVDKFHTSLGGPSFYISQSIGEGLIAHGTRDWKNYRVNVHNFSVALAGSSAGVIVRMGGLNRWYGVCSLEGGKEVGIVKARDERREILVKVEMEWRLDVKYEVEVVVEGGEIRGKVINEDEGVELVARDGEFEGGSVGLVICDGALAAEGIDVAPVQVS